MFAVRFGDNVKVDSNEDGTATVFVLEWVRAGGMLRTVWREYARGLTRADALGVADNCATVNAKFGGSIGSGYEE